MKIIICICGLEKAETEPLDCFVNVFFVDNLNVVSEQQHDKAFLCLTHLKKTTGIGRAGMCHVVTIHYPIFIQVLLLVAQQL